MSGPVVQQELYSLAEVAVVLGRSIHGVRALVAAGHFETLQLKKRGKIFVPRVAVDRFISANTLERTPPRASAAAITGRRARAAAR